jgi:hypothetical protein
MNMKRVRQFALKLCHRLLEGRCVFSIILLIIIIIIVVLTLLGFFARGRA